MSVHGEFQRYLEAVADALRMTGEPDHLREAREADRISRSSDEPLASRAAAVLDAPLHAETARTHWPPEAADAADRLIAIARIILGR